MEFNPLLKTSPSMSSDGQTVNLTISKEECKLCGTVRSADVTFLGDFYRDYYRLNVFNTDPLFIYNGVGMLKSKMHYEWIERLIGDEVDKFENVIEIGCGSGNLLGLFNCKKKHGVEPSKDASFHASKIASIRNIGFEDISNEEKYDLILSTCVIEHTINPNEFLAKKWNIASEKSTIVIGVPVQDTESFDVYFLDHLHHFTCKQFIYLCENNGFTVEKYEVGYKCMSTIAYFVLRKKPVLKQSITFEKNWNFYNSKIWIDNLNAFLDKNQSSNMLAFGYGETSFFYQTYSTLNNMAMYFIDDIKAGVNENVIRVSEAIDKGLLGECYLIFLTNPHYHDYLKKQFVRVKNLKFYSPFSNQLN